VTFGWRVFAPSIGRFDRQMSMLNCAKDLLHRAKGAAIAGAVSGPRPRFQPVIGLIRL
jgi:hypothetical protein